MSEAQSKLSPEVLAEYRRWKQDLDATHERIAWINHEIEGNEELQRDYQNEINQLWGHHDDLWNNVEYEWVMFQDELPRDE